MDYVAVSNISKGISPEDIVKDAELSFSCCVHKIKKRSGFTFVTLRTGKHTFLAVHNPKFCEKPLKGVFEGVYISVKCKIREEVKAENGLEIAITDYDILSKPCEKYPISVSDRIIDCAPEDMIENRPLTMRNPIERAPMLVLSSVLGGFSEFMRVNGFVNVKTPAITEIRTESEKDIFSLDYFGKNAYLNSDPGIYTGCAVAYFDRVYEIANVFSGKKRNSPRLLNEYTALHFDMAYLKDVKELMSYACSVVSHIIKTVSEECQYEFELLDMSVPAVKNIPCIDFDDALSLLKKEDSQVDLDPTDEKRISKWAEENFNSEFVFVTGYPTVKRPLYYKEKESFVLLYRGIEIGFGGLKKNEYNEDVFSKSYGEFFKYGMPPYGGVSIGAERLVMQLLKLRDIRQVALFPRDIRNVAP